MNVPALVVWLVDGEPGSQRRVNSIIQPVSMRLPAESSNELLRHIVVQMSDAETKDSLDLRVESWLNVRRIGQWQADGLLSEHYTLQVIVIPLSDKIEVPLLERVASKITSHIRDIPALAIVPLKVSLIWYVADRSVASMQLKQYWPRICISNRANDWVTSIETMVVSLIASDFGKWIDTQQATVSATNKDIDVIWAGTGSVGIGRQVINNLLVENTYRRLVADLRDDKITAQEIDDSIMAAVSQKRAYVRNVAVGVQEEFNEHFEWVLNFEETSNVTAPIRVGDIDRTKAEGFYLRKDATLAQRLFGDVVEWWQAQDKDFSQAKMFRDLLQKDNKPDLTRDQARITSDLATHFSYVHTRMSEVIVNVANKMTQSFFDQVFEKVKLRADYGIRDVQQNISDYVAELERADIFEYHGEVVNAAPTDFDSYFKELAGHVASQLDISMNKIHRRRQSVYSLYGSALRLVIALPLLLGLIFAFTPVDYKDYVDIAVPILLALVGLGSMLYWYYQYHIYAREIRTNFLHNVLGSAVLSIVKMIFIRERNKQIHRLQQMNKIYAEVIKSFDDQQVEGLKPVDDVKINKWYMHQLSMVFGTKSKHIVADAIAGDEIQGVVGEVVDVYDYEGYESLSLFAKIISLINRDAAQRGFPHGRILLLQEIASRMSDSLFTREGILDYIHEFCERYVRQIMHNPANAMNVFVVFNDAQKVRNANNVLVDRANVFRDGLHWNWLYTASNPNLIPRPNVNRGVEVNRFEIILIAEELKPNMITRSGRHNDHWIETLIEVPHGISNELTMLRLDIDAVERKGDKK